MRKLQTMLYLIVMIFMNFTCVEKKSIDKEINKILLLNTVKADTLKFGSGIGVIFQDSKSNYWFGIHNGGISKYDGKTFEYFTTNDGLLDNHIRSVQEDKNGNMLIATAKGLSIYNGQKFTNYTTNVNEPKYEWNKTQGDVWFYAGAEDGINRFDGIYMNYLIFPKPKNKNPNNSFGVTSISKAKGGNIWIATYSALFNYDGKIVNIFDNEKLNLKVNEVLHIRSVLADSKGRVWIGNNGIGLLVKEGDRTINFSEKHNLIHPTSTRNGNKSEHGTLEHVFAIEEDFEGNIWFGDRDTGAWRYDGKTIKNYTIDKNLKSQMVWTIYKDNNNSLLFGMASGGIYKFNGKSFDKMF